MARILRAAAGVWTEAAWLEHKTGACTRIGINNETSPIQRPRRERPMGFHRRTPEANSRTGYHAWSRTFEFCRS